MKKSHFNNEFLVLLGPIISSFFACSNEEKNKPKQQLGRALVLSLWFGPLFPQLVDVECSNGCATVAGLENLRLVTGWRMLVVVHKFIFE